MGKLNDLVRDSLENTPGVDPALNQKLVRRYERHLRRSGTAQKDDGYAMTVQGVERYRRSAIVRRFGAMAAAMALIVTIGGSTLLMYRAAPNDPMTDHSSSDEQSDSTEKYDYEQNSYDMSTQEGIYSKMANSCFFYSRVSANITEMEDVKANLCRQIDLSCSLSSGKCMNMANLCYYSGDIEDIVKNGDESGGEFIWQSSMDSFYCDGNNRIKVYNYSTAYEILDEEVHGQSGHPAAFESVLNYEKNNRKDEISPFNGTTSGIYAEYGTRVLLPYTCDAFRRMIDFSCWDYYENIEFCGRQCVEIKLNADDMSAEMMIDVETGCMLRYVSTQNGELTDFIVVRQISFDNDVTDIPEPDLNNLHQYDAQSTGYMTSTVGNLSYGSRGHHCLCVSDSTTLPDLIAFGKTSDGQTTYVNRDEFLSEIGCEIVLKQMRTAENAQPDDVMIYTLNLYDSAMKQIDSIDYYCSPDEYEMLFGEYNMGICYHDRKPDYAD